MYDDDDALVCQSASDSCEGTVRWTYDPYALEMDGEEIDIVICEFHYYAICDEI